MIITFANMKGGVGKSTICVSLSNYLASQGFMVRIYDVDIQSTLARARQEELALEPDRRPLFEITSERIERFCWRMQAVEKLSGYTMIDLPGSYSKEVIEILKHSDVVIVPFQYESYSYDATGMFATHLDLIKERDPSFSIQAIYVPNQVNPTIGRKEDKELWATWEAEIRKKAILAPGIPDKVCMKRRSTLYLNPKERDCVTPCFEYLLERIGAVKGGEVKI